MIDPMSLPMPPTAEDRNLAYREKLTELGTVSPEYRAAIKERCRIDPIFWFNAFCWAKDPKWRTGEARVPIILYPNLQDNLILAQRRCWEEGRSCACPKTREQGMSVITLYNLQHAWQFESRGDCLVGSAKEDNVDGKGWGMSMLPKIDFNLEHQPKWLLPKGFDVGSKKSRQHMKIVNPETGHMILGEATGKEFSRSGRYFTIAIDEAGVISILEDIAQAAGNATRSVMYLGTPKGRNYFHQICKNGTSIMLGKHDEAWNPEPCIPWDIHHGWHDKKKILVFHLHWTMNTAWTKGMYYCDPGCKAHSQGGKPHSERYDHECTQYHWNPVTIAQEMDIDWGKSGNSVFNMDMLDKCHRTVLDKYADLGVSYYSLKWDNRGEKTMVYDVGDKNAWYKASKSWNVVAMKSPGRTDLRVWKEPRWCMDTDCKCRGTGKHSYCIGSDIAKGLEEGDASCAYVLDVTAGKVVAELHSRCEPDDFAVMLMQLIKWYGPSSGLPSKPYTTVEWNDQGLIVNKILSLMGLGASQHVYTSEDKSKAIKSKKLGNVVQPMNRGYLLDTYAAPYISADAGDGFPLLVVPFPEFWEECMNMVRKNPGNNEVIGPDKPKVGKVSKSHDDRVWALIHCINGACVRHNNRVRGVIRRDIFPVTAS